MQENSITRDIARHLGQFPPFQLLSAADLLAFANGVRIRYVETGTVIFKEGQEPERVFYIVKKGAVSLYRHVGAEEVLIDRCDEGVLFGLRALLAGGPYRMSSRADEPTLLYEAPSTLMTDLLTRYPDVSQYLMTVFAQTLPLREDTYTQALGHSLAGWQKPLTGHFISEKKVISCLTEDTAMHAARLMQQARVGSLPVLRPDGSLAGMLTNSDLRNKIVATGAAPASVLVGQIMSTPVVTAPPTEPMEGLLLRMVGHQIRHICLTTDGTDNSEVVGVVSERDLLSAQGNTPAFLVRRLLHAHSAEELAEVAAHLPEIAKKLFQDGHDPVFIGKVLCELHDTLFRSAWKIVLQGHTPPHEQFCWLCTGAGGRREQVMLNETDVVLIVSDLMLSEPEVWSHMAAAQADLLSRCGFKIKQAGSISFVLDCSVWEAEVVYQANPSEDALKWFVRLADSRPLTGSINIFRGLHTRLFEHFLSSDSFQKALAQFALKNPAPLSFFRDFVLEKEGTQAELFDLKMRGLVPLAAAARAIVLLEGLNEHAHTCDRLEACGKILPDHRSLFQEALAAYRFMLQMQFNATGTDQPSGRYVPVKQLSKMERQQLKNCFSITSALQDLVKQLAGQ